MELKLKNHLNNLNNTKYNKINVINSVSSLFHKLANCQAEVSSGSVAHCLKHWAALCIILDLNSLEPKVDNGHALAIRGLVCKVRKETITTLWQKSYFGFLTNVRKYLKIKQKYIFLLGIDNMHGNIV